MTINDIQDEIIEEFALFPDWESKYEYLLEMENNLGDIDASLKTDDNLVHGCNSRAWVSYKLIDGNMQFQADAETSIARGILALILRVLNQQSPQDILNTDLYLLDRIGLKEHLSITRAQGLESLVNKLHEMARAAIA